MCSGARIMFCCGGVVRGGLVECCSTNVDLPKCVSSTTTVNGAVRQ